VKHLVERLGGQVRATNRPSGGAAFTVSLPLELHG
jgi:signal transduction histidine kinase